MDAPPCGGDPHPVSDAVSSACSGLGGGLLTCYSPFRHWAPKGPVRLACLIHAASVHSEPGSNSPSLKSPNGGESRHPVDSIINQLKDFIGEEPHASHGEPFHSKNHVRSYCAARFPKSRRIRPPFFVTAITLHRLSAFASGDDDFFHGKATPNVLKQKFDVSESTHFVPISKETP